MIAIARPAENPHLHAMNLQALGLDEDAAALLAADKEEGRKRRLALRRAIGDAIAACHGYETLARKRNLRREEQNAHDVGVALFAWLSAMSATHHVEQQEDAARVG